MDFETYCQEYNPEVFKFIHLNIINSTKHKVFNGSLMLNKDLEGFDILILITSPFKNGKSWTLLNYSTKACDFMEKANSRSKIFPYIFLADLYATNPDFPKKCPLKKVNFLKFI